MSKRAEQLEKELQTLREQVSQLSGRKQVVAASTVEQEVPPLVKQMIEDGQKANKLLGEIMGKIESMQKEIDEIKDYDDDEPGEYPEVMNNRELPLSGLERKIIDFVQSSPESMICADDLMHFMNYKGRNAACARLNKLYKEGLLDRYQLGHKVYYKFDAGKATNTLIISPPQ